MIEYWEDSVFATFDRPSAGGPGTVTALHHGVSVWDLEYMGPMEEYDTIFDDARLFCYRRIFT